MKAKMVTPNQLTILRLVLAIAIPFIFFQNSLGAKLLAAFTYAFAAITDIVDGILARRHQQITSLGKILDPIADKVLILGACLALVRVGAMSVWWLVPFLIREVGVTSARFVLLRKGKAVAATREGKLKVVAQHAAVLFVYLNTFNLSHLGSACIFAVSTLAFISLVVATWLTITSGYKFFKVNAHELIS